MTRTLPAQTALPAADAWMASWVEPVEPPDTPDARRPAYHLAGEFTVDGPVASAFLHATAHGLYEAFVNGTRVGDRELTPGFSAYRARLQVQAFDVTDLVVEGANALGALLSDGWWRGQHGVVRGLDAYGPTTAFLAELHVTLASGATVVVRDRWVVALDAQPRPRRRPDQRRVARPPRAGWPAGPSRAPTGRDGTPCVSPTTASTRWCRRSARPPAASTSCPRSRSPSWRPAATSSTSARTATAGCASPTSGPPARAHPHLRRVARPRRRRQPGQHLDGVVLGARARRRCRSRSTPSSRPATASPSSRATPPRASSTSGSRACPARSTPPPSPASSCTATCPASATSPAPTPASSACTGSPTGASAATPARSRPTAPPASAPAGSATGSSTSTSPPTSTTSATGRRSGSATSPPTSCPSGAVTNIVPDPTPDAPIWKEGHGAAGWGDAAVHVPWELHRATGRTDVLADQLDSMARWVDFAAGRAALGRHPSRVERNPEPLPHERYLWDSGWHFGEWLEPGVNMDDVFGRLLVEDHGAVATAYLYRSADELARIGSRAGPAGRGPALRRPRRRTCSTPGAPSSSTPTDTSRPAARPTSSAPWRSGWSPTTCGRRRPPTSCR